MAPVWATRLQPGEICATLQADVYDSYQISRALTAYIIPLTAAAGYPVENSELCSQEMDTDACVRLEMTLVGISI